MTATIPAGQTVTAVLTRADKRWAEKRCDDPADPAYLRHLADAIDGALPVLTDPAPVEVVVPDPGAEAIAAERDQLASDLAELRSAHHELATRHGKLHRDHAACTSLDTALHDERERFKEQVAKATERADFARIDRAAALAWLRALLEQILGEPVDGRTSAENLDALIDRAGLLVAAAVDQIDARLAEDVHVHQYPLDASGKPGKCSCDKPFPQPKGRH